MLMLDDFKETPFMCEMSNEDYHASPGVSNSGISLLLDCPFKYWNAYLNPKKIKEPETPSMRYGTMVHCFILEPEQFDKRYFAVPNMRRGTNAWKDYIQPAEGREIIFYEELENLKNIQRAIEQHKIAKHLFKNGHAEQSIFWTDNDTQILCKSRPDYLTQNYIVDIKTVERAAPRSFEKSIANFGYHRQAAIALDGVEAISGLTHTNFLNVCIEKSYPHVISVFVMSDEAIKQGRTEYKQGLALFKECTEKGHWPMYIEEIEEINLPAWATNQFNKGEILC